MDGFNSIPIQNAGLTSVDKPMGDLSIPNSFNSTEPYKDRAVNANDGIEVADDSAPKKEKTSFGFILPLSILILIGVFVYFAYLVLLRVVTLEKISTLSDQFQVLTGGLDKKELEEFLALDNSLRAIKQKLSTHTQLGGVLAFVNQNIRANVLVTDYRIESKEKDVVVGLISVAPSFKELAEQTEKMGELKATGAIKDFEVTQMSLESDGRKVRYTLNLLFDRAKISVTSLEKK